MIYLKLPTILGTVKAKGHKGWLHAESVSLSKKDPPWADDSSTGSSRLVIYKEALISRRSDRASIDLAKASLLGKEFDEATLAFVDPKSKKTTVRIAMTKATIEQYSMAGDGADPLETFILTFETLRASSPARTSAP